MMRLHEVMSKVHEGALKEWPEFGVGDTIKVHYKIKEGDKQRIQVYEGVVISIRGERANKSFIVRRISHEVGVERIFPWNSPSIEKIEVVRKGKVRRAKLFYIRHKSGKAGRIKEAREKQAKMVADQKAEKTKAKQEKEAAKAAAKAEAEAAAKAKAKEEADAAAKAKAEAEASESDAEEKTEA